MSSIGTEKQARRATFEGATFAALICATSMLGISICPTATFAKPIFAALICAPATWREPACMGRMCRARTFPKNSHRKK
jgi:hypothetical protein